MEADIRRKEKVEKATEFVERMKKIQENTGMALRKAQEEIKWQADGGRMEVKKQKKGDKIMLSTKYLVFKERLARKLVDQYIGPYIIDKIVSTNVIKLQLPASMRIHLIVSVSQVVRYRKQMKEQKVEEVKLMEVDRVKEQKVEKILNKIKIREVVKYLV